MHTANGPHLRASPLADHFDNRIIVLEDNDVRLFVHAFRLASRSACANQGTLEPWDGLLVAGQLDQGLEGFWRLLLLDAGHIVLAGHM